MARGGFRQLGEEGTNKRATDHAAGSLARLSHALALPSSPGPLPRTYLAPPTTRRTTEKMLRKKLEEELGEDLSSKKELIRAEVRSKRASARAPGAGGLAASSKGAAVAVLFDAWRRQRQRATGVEGGARAYSTFAPSF